MRDDLLWVELQLEYHVPRPLGKVKLTLTRSKPSSILERREEIFKIDVALSVSAAR